ncbi:hypothetical protein [Methylocystis parvus]|uniref:hypothetical protein n=1 Tax=Methylocystis parvus TaxID=134 RepID=UPI003C734886
MKLLDYLKEKQISDASFGAQFDPPVSEGAVRKWKYGERTPRLSELVRIEDLTGGVVAARDFLPVEEQSARSPFPAEAQ